MSKAPALEQPRKEESQVKGQPKLHSKTLPKGGKENNVLIFTKTLSLQERNILQSKNKKKKRMQAFPSTSIEHCKPSVIKDSRTSIQKSQGHWAG